eukprot:Hpha_TRINITY_DN35031_c0_g1::TRINITY_DN35031_c0_g1_i1::g.82766::m.82766
MLFEEYWKGVAAGPDPTTGYFDQGDVGLRDAQGYLYLVGRADDRMTLPSGLKIYPGEIERLLASLGGCEAAVIGIPRAQKATHLAICVVGVPDEATRQALAKSASKEMEKLQGERRPQEMYFLAPERAPR